MTDMNIHNFQHFLKELRKNLNDMEFLAKQESKRIQNLKVVHEAMDKMCQNWLSQLEHQK